VSGIHDVGGVSSVRRYDESLAYEETSLFGFMNVLLKYRGMLAVLMIACGIFGAVKYSQSKASYVTRIGINVASNEPAPDPTGLVAQLGLVPASGSAQEVAFFSELLRSPPLLRDVSNRQYTVNTKRGTVSGPLTRFYGFSGNPQLHEKEMTDILTDNITLSASGRTGNIWLFVDTPFPDLSQQVALNIIRLVDDYSRARKHAQASAEREFIQGRLAESKQELSTAEDAAVQFRVDNRVFSSPTLSLQDGRLLRDVSMKQQLYTSLLQSYDRARIAEAKNLPSITILEAPEKPIKPEPSSAIALPLLGAIAGLLLGIVVAFIRERMAETAASPTPAFEYYTELKRDAVRDLKNPLRPFGRSRKPASDG
jgi:uncharacterized protein involved in exopolysaccharide biosynthesis